MKIIKQYIPHLPSKKNVIIIVSSIIFVWGFVIFTVYSSLKKDSDEALDAFAKKEKERLSILSARKIKVQKESAFNYDTHRRMALQYYINNNYSEAIRHFEVVVDAADELFIEANQELVLKYINSLIQDRRILPALDVLDKFEAVSKNTKSSILRGTALYFEGSNDAAADVFRGIIQYEPDNSKALVWLGRIYTERDLTRKDIPDIFEEAISADTENPEPYYYYSIYHSNRGDYRIALSYVEKSIKLKPFESRYISGKGIIHYYLEEFEKARKEYELAITINPMDYNTLFNLGELYLNSYKKFDSAFVFYKRARKLNPQHYKSTKRMAILALNNRNYKSACFYLEICQKLKIKEKEYRHSELQIDKELAELYVFNAVALEAIGRSDDAIEKLNQALKENPLSRIAKHKLSLLTGS